MLTYPQNLYFKLGKILYQTKPEIAIEIMAEYLPARPPLETDLTKIPSYFTSFCNLLNINEKEYTGALYKSSKIDKRRLFVAVIILMYHPRTRMVGKYISETIGQDTSATRRMIEQVEFRYKHIEEFRNQVDDVVKKIITS